MQCKYNARIEAEGREKEKIKGERLLAQYSVGLYMLKSPEYTLGTLVWHTP
jgi:hypothetical protein